MRRVFKYTIDPSDYIELDLPARAQILSVQAQHDIPCLWALVDPEAPLVRRRFRFAGTGHPITEAAYQLQFISTFQMHGGSLVFHFFEVSS